MPQGKWGPLSLFIQESHGTDVYFELKWELHP